MIFNDYRRIRKAFMAQKDNRNPGARFGLMFRQRCNLEKLIRDNEHIGDFSAIRDLMRDMDKELKKADEEIEVTT